MPPTTTIRETLGKHISTLSGLGIVHRDLHLEQIMISNEGEVKLIDFGLSKFIDSEIQLRAGNTKYYTPSTTVDPSKYSFSDDLYALNIILGELGKLSLCN